VSPYPEQDAPDAEQQEAITGHLEHITFSNDENGFLVGRLSVDEGGRFRGEAVIRGILPSVRKGERIKIWGNWEEHPSYGTQFHVRSFLVLEPATLEGIALYLEHNIHGVGPKLAERIVKIFGKDTFRVIDETPEKLLEVPKFPAKVLTGLRESWAETRVKREIIVFCHSVGISPLFAERIFSAYGVMAVETIKNNPYRLVMDIQGIGFRSADQIARNMGLAMESPARVEAGVMHALDEASQEGHTGLPRTMLLSSAAELLQVAPELVEKALETLLGDGLLSLLERLAEPDAPPLVQYGRMRKAEDSISEDLGRIAGGAAFTRFKEITETVSAMEGATGISLSAAQRQAVEDALSHKLLVITGGPGTGKTTIIRFILGMVAGTMPQVALAAPTGKAAKRLGEATGQQATTLHRLLEASPVGFRRNRDCQLEMELIIVDESSMIDTLLLAALLAATPTHARLILVGDVDQLPSVGPGRILGDLIESGSFAVSRLETIFRQSEQSRITANAHNIRKGRMPDLSRPAGDELSDFYFIEEAEPERIVEKIRTMLMERIPRRFNLEPKNDVQVITPMHRGLTGARNLNQMLRQWLNPDGQEAIIGGRSFRVGDKVMQTRNDYEKEVFNGDMGEVVAYNSESGQLAIDFEGNRVWMDRKGMDNVTLGYAITVHKSQGSEYPAVILPLTTHHAIMLQRNLLYTAITRGRGLVVLIGTKRAVSLAVHNARPVVRHTGLLERLVAHFSADS